MRGWHAGAVARLGRRAIHAGRVRRAAFVLGAAAAIAFAAAFAVAGVALAAPADLDTSFGTGGKQTVDFGGFDRATHVALAPDGRIVVVGTTAATDGGPGDYAVARLNTDGTPDGSFGTDGKVTLGTPSNANDIGGGVVVLPNKQIVVTGQGNTTADFVTKRLNADGTLDTSFGDGGASTVDFGGTDQANAMARQPDGKLVLVGTTSVDGGDFAIARLNADGKLDTSFGTGGKRIVNFGGSPDIAFAVAITPDGKIVVAGSGGGGGDMVLTRLNSDGSNDTSFAPPGDEAFVDMGGANDAANAMALQPDGKIVLAGSTDAPGAAGFAIARLNPDGTLDTSFSGDGKLTASFGGSGEAAVGVVVQQNGKIVVLGDGDANHDFVLARYLSDGSVDSGFGTNGAVAVDFGGFEFDGDLALQPDGKLVLVGSTDANPQWDMAIARVDGDPVHTKPPPPTISVTTSTPPGGRGVIIRTHLGGNVSKVGIDMNGDGRPDFQSPASLPFVHITVPQTTQRPIKVIAITPTGATASTTIHPRIVGLGLPSNRLGPLVVASTRATLPSLVTPNPPCDQAQVVEDIIDARGCLVEVKSLGDLPASVTSAVARYYKNPVYPDWVLSLCASPKTTKEVCDSLKSLFNTQRTFISYKPVQLNGMTITPRGGSPVVIYPEQFRVFAPNASAQVGPFPLKSGQLDFDMTAFSIPFILPPTLKLTPPLFTFDARQGVPVIGGFPIDAGASLGFALDNGVRETFVTLNVQLPHVFDVFGSGDQPSAAAAVLATNDRPLHLDTLDMRVPHASLGGIGFDDVAFHYSSNGDTGANCGRDYWHATANVTLGEGPNGEPGAGFLLSPPPSQNGIAFCNGGFKSAGGVLNFGVPIPPPELFPGVLLNSINFAIQLDPTVLRGGATISAVDLFRVSGTLLAAFASPSSPFALTKADAGAELQDIAPRTFTTTSFAVGGALAISVPGIGDLNIAHGGLVYEYPDYIALGAHVDTQLGIFVFHGSLGGQANVRTRHFETDLSANICLRGVDIACAGGLGIVSSKGVVACLNIGPLHPGVGLMTNLKYEVWLIDGCKPSHYWVRDISPSRDATAAAGLRFTIARGETAKNVRLAGAGGAPKVIITGPGGQRLSASANGLSRSGALVALRADEFGATYIGVDHGRPGTYTITQLPGSVPLGALSTTLPGYDTNFTGQVTGHGNRLTLHYDARRRGGGQRVTFYEEGTNVMHALGTSTGGQGRLNFTPASGPAGTRTIVASATVDGSPIADQTLARFHFAGTVKAGEPRAVTVRRRGTTVTVSWSPVAGAIGYGVLVNRSGGAQQRFLVPARRHSLTIKGYPLTQGGVIGVSAHGALGDWGHTRHSARFKALRTPPSMFLAPRGKRR